MIDQVLTPTLTYVMVVLFAELYSFYSAHISTDLIGPDLNIDLYSYHFS